MRAELDHRRLGAERLEGARGLEAEQTTADDGAADGAVERVALAAAPDLLDPAAQRRDVVDRAVHEHAGQLVAGDRRHERVRAGRDGELVVVPHPAQPVGDLLGVAVDRVDLAVAVQRDPGVVPHRRVAEHELLGVARREVRREGDAVVREPGLLGEDRDAPGPRGVPLEQGLDEALGDHAAADDDQVLGELWSSGAVVMASTLRTRRFGTVRRQFRLRKAFLTSGAGRR
ncbi:hypothetical protein GCM10025865_07860 [Paraoerskovia sediminicola]|uniref:Uncharacterized protein n=1 Tax=Paraoerskovia sediminicola TaxID=1138587 RepID=A0ABN6X9P9_9CELL|nr:hypothetical protein GCM10025865_07860 [Paraoerskovia sediminicola]